MFRTVSTNAIRGGSYRISVAERVPKAVKYHWYRRNFFKFIIFQINKAEHLFFFNKSCRINFNTNYYLIILCIFCKMWNKIIYRLFQIYVIELDLILKYLFQISNLSDSESGSASARDNEENKSDSSDNSGSDRCAYFLRIYKSFKSTEICLYLNTKLRLISYCSYAFIFSAVIVNFKCFNKFYSAKVSLRFPQHHQGF